MFFVGKEFLFLSVVVLYRYSYYFKKGFVGFRFEFGRLRVRERSGAVLFSGFGLVYIVKGVFVRGRAWRWFVRGVEVRVCVRFVFRDVRFDFGVGRYGRVVVIECI